MKFRNLHTTDLHETSIHTATDEHGSTWTLVATADGSDIVVGPNGGHIDGMLSTAPVVAEFLSWIVDEIVRADVVADQLPNH